MLPRPDFRNIVEKEDAINKDIRDVIEKDYFLAVPQAKPLAAIFKGANELETALNIWNFFRNKIRYKKDEEGYQDIKLPRRFFHDRQGDCKSYALNAMAIYSAIYPGLGVAPKYTAYNEGATEPGHVYAALKTKAGDTIFLDGCYDLFNIEKTPTLALPLRFMKVRTLSEDLTNTGTGSGSANLRAVFEALSPAEQKQFRQAVEAKMMLEQLKGVKNGSINGISEAQCELMHDRLCNMEINGGIYKKTAAQKAANKAKRKRRRKNALHWVNLVALSIARPAFNLLVGLNLFGLATKLHDMETRHPKNFNNVLQTWYDLGGLKKHLKKVVNRGAKKKPFFLSKKARAKFEAKEKAAGMSDWMADSMEDWQDDFGGIGVAPALAALSALPVLIPIILKVTKEFKAAGDTKNAAYMHDRILDAHKDFSPGGVADVAANDPLLPDAPQRSDFPTGHQFGKVDETAEIQDTGGGFLGWLKRFFGIHGIADDPLSDDMLSDDMLSEDATADLEAASADVGIDVATKELNNLADAGLDKLNNSIQNAANVDPIWKELGNTAIDGAEFLAGSLANKVGADAKHYVNNKIVHRDTPYPPHLLPRKPHAHGIPPAVYVGGGLVLLGGVYLLMKPKAQTAPAIHGISKSMLWTGITVAAVGGGVALFAFKKNDKGGEHEHGSHHANKHGEK